MNSGIRLKHQLIFSVTLLSLLGFTLYLYWKGLPGRFILDDETNLFRLNLLNRNPSIDSLLAYIVDGLSSALGRPISLLSFAAQFYSWPKDPGAFKYVNIMIHLLNGIFVLILSRQLLHFMKVDKIHALYFSLAVSAIWLLHPIQISTVLYVVQRMTQLSALFMLIGMVCYFHGRRQIIDTPLRTISPFIWMSLGIGAGGILSVLSKENGILLPLYVLAIEFTLLQNNSINRFWKVWRSIFLYLPVILLGLYIIYSFNGFLLDYNNREFSMMERLLTESRVLSHYIFKIIIIQPSTYGLFQDDFPLSKNLISPLSTLPAVIFIIALLVVAVRTRKQNPLLSLVIFWFFVSHFLESGFIPLEIYFEHRNYLAMFGLSLGIVVFSVWLIRRIKSTLVLRATLLAGGVWALILVAISSQEIGLWGKPLLQAQIWGKERPWSKRAQVTRVNVYALYGQYKKASASLHQLFDKFPKNAEIYFSLFQLQCLDQRIKMYDFDDILKRIKKSRTSFAAITTLAKIMLLKEQGKCSGLKNTQLEKLLGALITNEKFHSQLADLYFLKARYYLLHKNSEKALKFLNLSWQKQQRMVSKMYQIQIYAYLKQYKTSFQHILEAKKYLQSHFKERFLYREELTKWEELILLKLSIKSGTTR